MEGMVTDFLFETLTWNICENNVIQLLLACF